MNEYRGKGKDKKSSAKKDKYLCRAVVAFGFPSDIDFANQPDWMRNDMAFVSWPLPVDKATFQERGVCFFPLACFE